MSEITTQQPAGEGQPGAPSVPGESRKYTDDEVNKIAAKAKRAEAAEHEKTRLELARLKEAQMSESEKLAEARVKEAVSRVSTEYEGKLRATQIEAKLATACAGKVHGDLLPAVKAYLPADVEPEAIAAEVERILTAHPALKLVEQSMPGFPPGGPSGGGSATGRPWSSVKVNAYIAEHGHAKFNKDVAAEVEQDRRSGAFIYDR